MEYHNYIVSFKFCSQFLSNLKWSLRRLWSGNSSRYDSLQVLLSPIGKTFFLMVSMYDSAIRF
ncbi:hypothetical protein PsorP6_013384 [Peronosclerospora sorghi]|uniref:Uncharacterized protein n=1 Tax=Peronosclerospora sorghi TaxID=230839 RepID=A0ACC0WEQ5_9STRA|nr:hypothetical protein PsorP6_013384 [Peronosclerospora sorghi]